MLALAEDPEQPLLERVKFAGIMGMVYDEFAMKRVGGLFREVQTGKGRRGPEGLTPAEVLEACRAELRSQQELVARLVEEQLRPALRDLGTPILDIGDLDPSQRDFLARYFADSVEPILTPLAADAAHPFPFYQQPRPQPGGTWSPNRVAGTPDFVRIKVPASLPAMGAAAGPCRLGAPGAGHRRQPERAVPAGGGVGLLLLPGHQGGEG